MKKTDDKQAKALSQFEELKSRLLKLLLLAPDHGNISLTVHFYDGEVSRFSHGIDESVLVGKHVG